MSELSGQRGWPAQEERVPIVPEWIFAGGYRFVVLATALAIIWAIAHVGHAVGHDIAEALFVAALCCAVALWRSGYRRRLEANEALKERAQYQAHELAKVDAMTGPEFEKYCAVLLRARGYRNISVIGGTGDGGADILATAPDGTNVAVQCKRWKISVGPEVIHALIGTTSLRRHQGRTGIVMTNALVTPGAQHDAEDAGIQVVHRPTLQQWMLEARNEIEERGHTPQAVILTKPGGMRVEARVLTGALCIALTLLIFYAFPLAIPRASITPTKLSPRAATPGPAAVIRGFFAAINNHDWHTVWRLWYHPEAGYGPGYYKMISGYRLTARDVVTSIKSSGTSVAAQVLAYETTGAIERFDFHYRVHYGKITWGHSVLLGISYPRQNPPVAPSSPA
jgi:HJR/Mrr/RecB family endonuclease